MTSVVDREPAGHRPVGRQPAGRQAVGRQPAAGQAAGGRRPGAPGRARSWLDVVAALPDPTFVLDPDERIVGASTAAARLIGCRREGLATRPFSSLVAVRHRDAWRVAAAGAQTGTGGRRFVHGLLHTAGSFTVVETRVSDIGDGRGLVLVCRPLQPAPIGYGSAGGTTAPTARGTDAATVVVANGIGDGANGAEVESTAHSDLLSPREAEVLRLLAHGLDVRAISDVLDISVHTTRGYVKALLRKLNVRSQLQAVVVATQTGLLD